MSDPKDRRPAIWPGEFDPGELLRRLVAAGVDFVVIGGIAAVLHGSARLTRDLDIVFAPDAGNLEALARVLPADATLACAASRRRWRSSRTPRRWTGFSC